MIAFERVTVVAGNCEAEQDRAGGTPLTPFDVAGLLSAEEAREYRRISPTIRYVPNECFGKPETEGELFGPQPLADDGSKAGLSAARERRLFLQLNYARFRLTTSAAGQGDPLAQAREMIAWNRRAESARAEITQANLALVVGFAKRCRYPNVDFGDLIAEGNMALLRSVDSFDISRGFRFSTYACQCIIKCFHRMAAKAQQYRVRCGRPIDETMEPAEPQERQDRLRRHAAVESLREAIRSSETGLTPVEKLVVTARFGLSDRQEKCSLAEVGEMTGLPNSRVRRIQQGAIAKIRAALVDLVEV